jgi:hypothetical protein
VEIADIKRVGIGEKVEILSLEEASNISKTN